MSEVKRVDATTRIHASGHYSSRTRNRWKSNLSQKALEIKFYPNNFKFEPLIILITDRNIHLVLGISPPLFSYFAQVSAIILEYVWRFHCFL